MLWAREWNTKAGGTWEEVRTCMTGKVPLLGRARGGGADCHRELPAPEQAHVHPQVLTGWGGLHRKSPAPEHAHAHRLSEGRAALVQAMGGEKPLAHLGEIGHSLCRLQVARHLLCGLKGIGG